MAAGTVGGAGTAVGAAVGAGTAVVGLAVGVIAIAGRGV